MPARACTASRQPEGLGVRLLSHGSCLSVQTGSWGGPGERGQVSFGVGGKVSFTGEWLWGSYRQAWCGAAPGHPGRILGRDGGGRQLGCWERSLQDQGDGTDRTLAGNRVTEPAARRPWTGQPVTPLETDKVGPGDLGRLRAPDTAPSPDPGTDTV